MSLDDDAAFGMKPLSAFSLPGPKPARRTTEPARAPVPTKSATLAGMDVILDGSGALYWPAEDTLVVADLHLETGSSYARSGQMLPPYDSTITLGRLFDAIARHQPSQLIALGDSFHDPFGAERLSAEHQEALAALGARLKVIWITGNHDHDGAASLCGTACDALSLGGATFKHIPTEGMPDEREVAGHLHPAARIVVRGRTLKRRAFVGCTHRLVMPAFGCLTGGLPVSDPAFSGLWPGRERPNVHLIGQHAIHAL